MKCPNCYNENEPGSTNCKYCGTVLPEENEIESEIISNNEENGNNYNEQEYEMTETQIEPEIVSEEVKVKNKKKKVKNKKSKKIVIVILLILFLIAACAGGVYCYITNTTPDKIYKKTITQAINSVFNNQFYDAKSLQFNAKIEVGTDESSSLSDLNGFVIDTSFGFDLNDQQALLKLKVDQGEDAYLASTLFGDLKRERVYIGDENLFSKLVSIDIPEEYIEQINDLIDLEKLSKQDTSASRAQIAQILTDVINKNLKVENMTRENTKIQYNGKQKTVKDNMLILTEGEFKIITTNILNELNSNETFLTALGDNREEVVNKFEELLEEIKYLNNDEDVESPNKIVIHLYTSGLKYEFMGVKLEAISSDNISKITAQVVKTAENTYTTDYIKVEGEEIIETTMSVTINSLEDGTTDLIYTFNYNDIPVSLKINYNYSINQGIQEINLDNVVKITDLKDEDYEEMLSNLEDSPLYTIVYLIKTYVEENGIDFEFNGGINSETSLPNNVKLEPNQSYVITKNDDIAVFEVPTAFEPEYSGNTYKSYRKNNRIGDKSEVYINLISGNAKELIDEYRNSYDYLTEKVIRTEVDEKGNEYQVEEESKYKDVSISDIKEEIVNGVSYYRIDVRYTSDTIKNNITYYATQLTNDYSYVVRVEDGSEIISSSEIEKILSITKY